MDMQTGWNENRALLRGTAAAEPVLSHETHGVVYETFPLAVRRLSGSEDRVNVLVPRALLEQRPSTPRSCAPPPENTKTSSCWRGCCASRRWCGAPRWAGTSAI